jgi:uncharacterized protein (DUF1501 family)
MHDSASTRRTFLQHGLALLAATPTVPALLDPAAVTAASPRDVPLTARPDGTDGRALVIVQLSGGNDGLNTVVPFTDDSYHRARPTLRLAAKPVHALNDTVGLHPNLCGLLDLYARGNMALLQAVGYPNADRSHFRAADVWHSARPECAEPPTGWLGRYFDGACGGDAGPDVGVHCGATLPLSMRGERVTPLTLGRGESVGPVAHGKTSAGYPTGEFGDDLRRVAAMIRGGAPTRVYSVQLGGFDTHTNQRNRHDRLMRTFGDAIGAFWRELRAQRDDGRVLMLAFSEFGRTVAENASGGTDHGAAAPVFLFGPGVKGDVYGENPSLTDLDSGGLKHQVDFRRVYATILQQWLDAPSEPVLGRRFEVLPLIRRRRN